MSFDASLGRVGTASAVQLIGPERFKYFRRPVLPAMSAAPLTVLLAPTVHTNPLQPPAPREAPARSRTIAVQTDYRESEAQTDPYSPDYTVPEGTDPEVLHMVALKFGAGLPATGADLVKIDRIRARKALEQQMPEGNDATALATRARLLEQIERTQWEERERDVAELQEERLARLRLALEAREQEQARAREQRLNRLRRQRALQLDNALSTIERHRVQVMRKLADARTAVPTVAIEQPKQPRDLVSAYATYSSKVYAPVARDGAHVESRALPFHQVAASYTHTTRGLYSLTETIGRSSADLSDRVRTITAQAKSRALRAIHSAGPHKSQRELRQAAADLERVAAKLESDGKPRAPPPPPRSRHPVERPIERPPTPTVSAPTEDEDAREQAALFLQRLLRGRAAQNEMFLGKERRSELLDELRQTVTTPPPPAATEAALVARAAVADGLAGQVLGDALHVLAQHRVREMMRHEAILLAQTAETQRRAREAEESGLRQRELRAHARAEERSRQLHRVHAASAASLIDSALAAAVDQAASVAVAASVAGAAAEPAGAVTGAAAPSGGADGLVAFLIPDVAREVAARLRLVEENKHQAAARAALRSLEGSGGS